MGGYRQSLLSLLLLLLLLPLPLLLSQPLLLLQVGVSKIMRDGDCAGDGGIVPWCSVAENGHGPMI